LYWVEDVTGSNQAYRLLPPDLPIRVRVRVRVRNQAYRLLPPDLVFTNTFRTAPERFLNPIIHLIIVRSEFVLLFFFLGVGDRHVGDWLFV